MKEEVMLADLYLAVSESDLSFAKFKTIRNELKEKLGKNLPIPSERFTKEQLSKLSTEERMDILYRLLKWATYFYDVMMHKQGTLECSLFREFNAENRALVYFISEVVGEPVNIDHIKRGPGWEGWRQYEISNRTPL